MIKKILCILGIILGLGAGIVAQENLNVLPDAGRNELFHAYLMAELDTLVQKRNHDVEDAIINLKLLERQTRLKTDLLKLLGTLPEKTPLNDTVTGTLVEDGYNIDKVCFESIPNHHVTANFYYPTNMTGPFPGIIMPCGHYSTAKAEVLLQQLCILLVKHGFAVLIVDPIGQGERVQILNPNTGKLYYSNESGTKEHSRLDVGSVIVGTSVVAYELWDNHRAIDYLISRTEVDASNIGCTGSSGGGAQATYLSAFDDRIKVTVIDSYIMNEQTLFKTIGPQTGSQNLSYEGLYGIDHPDFLTIFAPKPFLITASTNDFFNIGATRKTYAEEQPIFNTLDTDEKIGMFESVAEHGLNKEKREKTVQWFRNWFYDDNSTITEPTLTTLSATSLRVTATGQVMTSFENEKNVTMLNIEKANTFEGQRQAFWTNNTKDSCLKMVSALLMLNPDTAKPVAETVETIDRGNYTVDKIKISQSTRVPVTGLLFSPKTASTKMPAILYVDGRGKNTDASAGGLIEKAFVDSGKIVFAIDVRGFGETTDNPSLNESKHGNVEHRNSVIGLYIGKTLIGQRVDDIRNAMDYLVSLADVDTNQISLVGLDRACISVLHAAALDSRYSHVVVHGADSSWMDIIEDPTILNNMTHEVPSSMMYYDLPDLVNAISPEKVSYNPPDYVFDTITGINQKTNSQNILEQNFPNPFVGSTTINYSLAKPANVRLIVCNLQGSTVKVLADGKHQPDIYKIHLESSEFSAGIYFYKLIIDGRIEETKKMVVIN